MLSSLRAIVESGAHMEPCGVDPNPLDDEDSDLDSRDCQAGQSIQESRTKYVIHASWDNSPRFQILALKPSPDFCVVDLSLRVEPKWMLGPKCFHNGQVSAVYSNGAEKSETHIGTLKPASTGVPFPGKKVLPYTDDVVNDSSSITLSNEGLDSTNEVETTKASSERVDKGTP